ncbi:MAG: hemerythrin domain-containing protein [Acidobacteriota bacterium]
MGPAHVSPDRATLTPQDGFDALDVCHRKTLVALGRLAGLIARLTKIGADEEARVLAREIVGHFSTTAREHHQDEERHVFPKLMSGGDPETVQAVLRLRQDHGWLEEDWLELSPHLNAVASGQSGYDLDVLRESAEVFTALSHDHIALEESFIYPQARKQLAPGERRDMGREMAARRRAQRTSKNASQ